MGNESIPIGQTARADADGDAGRHDLLRPAAAHAEQEFDRGPVDQRAEGLKLPGDLVDLAVPGGFGGHEGFTMLVRTCAKCKVLERMISVIILLS